MQELKAEITEKDRTMTIALSGHVTGVEFIRLTNRIEAAAFNDTETVVLDLTAVTGIESSALGGVIYCQTFLEKRNKKLHIADRLDHLKVLFLNCPLEKVLSIIAPGTK